MTRGAEVKKARKVPSDPDESWSILLKTFKLLEQEEWIRIEAG